MKVYIGSNPQDGQLNFDCNTIGLFNNQVLDSEANEIVCENLFSSFHYSELADVISLICKKMRLRGKLVIKEFDFYFISKIIFRGESTTEEVNNILFKDGNKIKSILTLDLIESLLPQDSFRITKKEFGKIDFTIQLERVQ